VWKGKNILDIEAARDTQQKWTPIRQNEKQRVRNSNSTGAMQERFKMYKILRPDSQTKNEEDSVKTDKKKTNTTEKKNNY